MIGTECLREEDKPLLAFAFDDPDDSTPSEDHREAAIPRGVANHLGRWPGHLRAAFVTGSTVFAAFTLFGIIVTALIVPSEEEHRMSWSLLETPSPNLYFVKHENRTWNSAELCYIESTARTWANLTVYLIDLAADNRDAEPLGRFSVKLLESNGGEFGGPGISAEETLEGKEGARAMIEKQRSSEEWTRRRQLADFYSNVKNVVVPIRRLFNGSTLVNVCDDLTSEMLELAGRAYVLWNFPGVAIDPKVHETLESLEGYLCKNENGKSCAEEKAAAVRLDGEILASSVPCQAFIDYLIREIARNDRPEDRQRTMETAIDKFCPRPFFECPGVKRIPQSDSRADISKLEKLNCPTIIRGS